MGRFSAPDDFMGGFYFVRFESALEANDFMKRFSSCPVWPVVSYGLDEDEVFILALEPKAQAHGDFTQENNTLVKNPEYLGAQEVTFRRDDNLLDFFKGHILETGFSDVIPCGSDCETCPRFNNPCQGCPAFYDF